MEAPSLKYAHMRRAFCKPCCLLKFLSRSDTSLLPFPWPKQVTWPRWPSKEGGLLGRRRTRNIWTETVTTPNFCSGLSLLFFNRISCFWPLFMMLHDTIDCSCAHATFYFPSSVDSSRFRQLCFQPPAASNSAVTTILVHVSFWTLVRVSCGMYSEMALLGVRWVSFHDEAHP